MSGLHFLSLCLSGEKPWICCDNILYVIIISNRKETKLRSGPWSPAATRWWMLVMYAWTVLPSSLHLPPSPRKKRGCAWAHHSSKEEEGQNGGISGYCLRILVGMGIWSPKIQTIKIENVCNFFTTWLHGTPLSPGYGSLRRPV